MRAWTWIDYPLECLGKNHQRDIVSLNKVCILNDGSATCSELCCNYLQIKEQISTTTSVVSADDFRGEKVFMKTPNDDQLKI